MADAERAKRLREAREAAQLKRREAAESLAIPYPTIASHENGTRAFDADDAERYCRRYKVRLEWLLTGKGPASAVSGKGPGADSIPPGFGEAPAPYRAPQQNTVSIGHLPDRDQKLVRALVKRLDPRRRPDDGT
jgi:transcriptional regulator with XRE-family HTH domain